MNLGTPWMLLWLPLVPILGWLLARARRLQQEAACRLKGAEVGKRTNRLGRRDGLVLAALVCVILALARPRWNPRPYEVERRGRDLVIAIDVSRSMLAADVPPSRLEMARIAIHEALPELAGQRIALISFAGSASVRVPLTLDHGFVRYMLQRADPSNVDRGGTSLQAAFETAIDTVLTDSAGGRRDLIVFTDGEDHLSDLAKTRELIAESGARVLIIGLGDPTLGARVPDALDADHWMQHNNVDVVSRLDENTLQDLAQVAKQVTYYPARTRPFDLAALYEKMIAGATDDVVVGELHTVRYTEGYPYLLVFAVLSWFGDFPAWRPFSVWRPGMRYGVLLLLLLPGCGRQAENGNEVLFRERTEKGQQLLGHAEEQSTTDLFACRSLLVEAREEYLLAALLKPGDVETARQITTATRRLRELDAVMEQQRAEEAQRHEDLVELIRQLQALCGEQSTLFWNSQQVVYQGATWSKSEERDLANSLATAQKSLREKTSDVLNAVQYHRDRLREILTRAYGSTAQLPATELDPPADVLASAVASQTQALGNLDSESIPWAKVNSSFYTATGRMNQALDLLRALQPPEEDQSDSPSRSMNDVDQGSEEAEAADSDAKKGQPMSSGDYSAALLLQAMPEPNYTSAEILAEEAANQEKRARNKAARAGSKVEKNW